MGRPLCKKYYACRFDYRIYNFHKYMEYELHCVSRILWIKLYTYYTIYGIEQYMQ